MRFTMKQQRMYFSAAVAVAVMICGTQLRAAPTVVNGDFETDTDQWITWPGYAAGGENPVEITGWTGSGGYGINPVVPAADSDAPFRDNGDNTTSVAFLQGESYIEQDVSGFEVGQSYVLSLDFNARDCCGDFPIGTIYLNDIVAGTSVDLFPAPGAIIPAGDSNPWYTAAIEFAAPTDVITVRIAAQPAAAGDATMLVDNVSFSLVPEPTSGVLALLGALGMLAVRRR